MFCFLSRLFDADRSSVRCDDASLDRFPTHAPCSANAMRAVENPIPTALAGLFDHQNRRGFFPFPQHGDKGVHGVRPVTRQRFDLAERDRASVQRLRFSECGLRGLVSSLFDESPRAPFRSSPDREPEPSKRRTSRRRRVHALAAHPVVEIRALVADNAGELSERRTTAPAMAGDF